MYDLESDDKGQRFGDLKTVNSYVEELAVSIVHEYLLNKELGLLSKTENFGSHSSLNTTTLLLVKNLDIESLWKINKNSFSPLKTVLEVILKFFILNFNSKSQNFYKEKNSNQEFKDRSDTYTSSVNTKQPENSCCTTLSEKESKSTSKFAYEAGETIKIAGVDKSTSCQRNLSLSREVCDLSTSFTLSSSFPSSFTSTSISTVLQEPLNSSTNCHHHYHYGCHNPSSPLSRDKDKKEQQREEKTRHNHFSDSNNKHTPNSNNTDIVSSTHYQLSEFDHYSNSVVDAYPTSSYSNNNNNYHLKSRGIKQQTSTLSIQNKNEDLDGDEFINRNTINLSRKKSGSSLEQNLISNRICSDNIFKTSKKSNKLVMSNVQVSKPTGVNQTSTGSNDDRFNIANTNNITNTRPSQTHGNVTSSNVSKREKETSHRRRIIKEDFVQKNNFRERNVGSSSSSGTTNNEINSFSSRNNVEDNDFVESLEPLSSTSDNISDREHTQQQQQAPTDKFDFQIRRNISKFVPAASNKNRNIHHQSESSVNLTTRQQQQQQQQPISKLSLAQSLLASKQNMLAEMSLTPEENLERKQSPNGSETMLFESSTSNASFHSFSSHKSEKDDENKMKMTLCDIEDEDFDFEDHESRGKSECGKSDNLSSYNCNTQNYQQQQQQHQPLHKQQVSSGVLNIHKSHGMHLKGRETIRTMDVKTWLDLKTTVLGSHSMVQDGWIGQGFVFDHHIPYGLVQTKGGPCGVLAVVQSLVLRNLMFGSPFYEDEDLPISEPITNLDASTFQLISNQRAKALVYAITEILWRCSHPDQQLSKWQSKGKDENVWSELSLFAGNNRKNEESSEGAIVCFSNVQAGSEIRVFEQEDDLRAFIQSNLQRFDCISLVYSAVLSRGLENVQNDFDFPNSLLGSHGYCSQELVNLLSTGQAVSNVFDNEIALDDKVLKGITSRADIGFLSLFEHFDSCQVGSFLKHPKYPVWIVCSESHFSILFSLNSDIVNNSQNVETFDLFYYDGLARQEKQIKLTIELVEGIVSKSENRRVHNYVNNNNYNNNLDEGIEDDDLVPPLEKCIRTKWKNCNIDWNDTEPIL